MWEPISDSKLHLAATLGSNSTVCLDVDSDNNIITTTCKCLSGDNTCDPASQWFKLVNASISVTPTTSSNSLDSLAEISAMLGYRL